MDAFKIERDRVYEEIWAEPVRTVAKRYGISDVALAKVCRKLDVPRPPLGYWARKEHGYAVERTPLPPLRSGVSRVATISTPPPRRSLSGDMRTRLAEAGGDRTFGLPWFAVNDLEKRQAHRRRFLRRLYEVTGGNRFTQVPASEIAADIGLTPDEASHTTDYLSGQRLVKWETIDGGMSITPEAYWRLSE